MDPIQIYYDSLVSHTIWFTIDCIHEIVLLRFDSIFFVNWKNRVLLPCSDCNCIRFDLVLI
jgi:hypothetical protein